MRRVGKIARILLPGLVIAILIGIGLLMLLDHLYPFPTQRIEDRLAAAAAMLRASDHTLIAWRVDGEENRRLGIPRERISPWLVEATIAVEDKRFREHRGVDPVAVCRAFLQNATRGRRVSGASTITMQTIRLLWQRPRRMESKIIEAFRAWQLERLADKERILEIYCNLAPYGGNTVGVEAAARRYFGKSAEHLNLAEAALLAGLPRSPSRLNPLRNPEAARLRRDFVLGRMFEDGRIDAGQAERARREELRLVPPESRLDAEHFADFALAAEASGAPEMRSTIDADLQEKTFALVSLHAESLSGKGVAGPAVVVLNLADSGVRAYVGNASPKSSPAHMVDGVRIGRQPGSLLKPFIFALLAERGKLAPSTLVYDLPRAWRDYAPRNMDRQWRGAMAAGDALRESRNLTAVNQLASLGVGVFVDFMKDIGLDAADERRHGLSLALGSKEQSLLGLANAYAALGRMGLWLPPRLFLETPPAPGRRVLTPAAAWLALSALSLPEEEKLPRRVWKTGTSWNQLDAWAVAMTPETVVGVWCGRLARGGSGWTAGSEDALPLALAVLEAAEAGADASWPPPEGVEFREVCAGSGAHPGWHCPEIRVAPMLGGNRGGFACTLHGAAGTATAAAAPTASRAPVETVKILAPTHGATYVNRGGSLLPLLAESPAEGPLVWFVNGEKEGTGKRGQALDWPMRRGDHRISVSDAAGNVAALDIRIVDAGE